MDVVATAADVEAWPESTWQEWQREMPPDLTPTTFFVEENAEACGMARGVRARDDPATAMLVAMWMCPASRRRGIGRPKRLLESAGFEPRPEVQQLAFNPYLSEQPVLSGVVLTMNHSPLGSV